MCARSFRLELADTRVALVVGLLLLPACDVVLGLDPRPTTPDADPSGRCPASYEPIGTSTSRYRIIGEPASFVVQAQACRVDSDGSTRLVILETEAEAASVGAKLRDLAPDDGDRYWVGLRQTAGALTADANWAWLTGAPPLADLWMPGEPDDGNEQRVETGVQDRAALDPLAPLGFLEDRAVGNSFGALCECEP
ncbi:MAG: hypothetical protein M3680_12250 [Myxococcota bacterium]|nr:hypothetical protein [Myxococcota bacterium]